MCHPAFVRKFTSLAAAWLCAASLVMGGCANRPPPAGEDTSPTQASATEEHSQEEIADFLLVREQAETGDANAQLLLAEKLLAGIGTAADPARGLDWLQKSAASSHPPAQDLLAALFYRGAAGLPVDYRQARALMEKAVVHQYLPAINNLAWLLSTCPDPELRDGKRAVALLQPVIDQSPQMLDTLAAAYAETGDFEQAVELQQKAIAALAKTADGRLPDFVGRLLAYRAGRPWRDPPAP